jgi:chromosome segregation ATPase
MMNIQQAINTMKARLARAGAARLAAERLRAIIASARRAAGWALALPLKVWVAAAALIFAGLWLQEHDARVRAAAELQRVKQQTTQQVVALQSQAEAAVRAANRKNAAAVAGLEAQRRKIVQRADQLTAQLQSLRQQQQKRDREIVAMPPEELAKQLAQRLGPLSAVRSPSQPQAGLSQSPVQRSAAGTPPLEHQRGQLALSTEGQRKVAAALDDLDSCRTESALQERRLSNCREQISAADAEIRTQADSLAKLNQALRAKDSILAARESEFKTELAAARGTWSSRALRALKFMAVGVGIGLAMK